MSEAHGARQEHGRFNLSAWALTHKPLIGFLMVIALLAGVRAYNGLGRDEDPPFTNQSTTFQQGYDPRYTDPLGRTWYARVTYKF